MKTKVIAAVTVLFFAVTTQAAESSRKATIEDTSGVNTEVTELECSDHSSGHGDGFINSEMDSNNIIVFSSGPDIAIPISHLISITSVGGKAAVTYLWRGQQRTISGQLDTECIGKSDFGDFKLNLSKLRKLSFSEAPSNEENVESRFLFPASLVLKSGGAIALSNVCRRAVYFSSEGYFVGGSDRYVGFNSFSFMRGESLATLEFYAIRKLEFSGANAFTVTVIVTLKSGATTTGTLPQSGKERVNGWWGLTDKGYTYVDQALVRSVEFGTP